MEKFKNKKTGVIYEVNSESALAFFLNNSNYEKIGAKANGKKTTKKDETEEVETPETTEDESQVEN